MSFLKRLAGALRGAPATSQDDMGLYVYVRLRRSGEIVRVRLQKGYDISENDEGQYFARKLIMGSHSFDKIEATFLFSSSYRLLDAEFSMGAELSDEAAYLAQQEGAK